MKLSFYHLLVISCLVIIPMRHIHAQGYDLTVRILHFKDSAAYLGYNFGDQKFVKDTSLASNDGTLRFRDATRLPAGVYFIYAPSVYFEIIVNEQKFTIETDTSDLVGHMKITGSRENKIFNDFQKFMAERQARSADQARQLDSLRTSADTTGAGSLQQQLAETGEEVKSYQKNLIETNSGTYVAKLVQGMQKPEIPNPPLNEKGEVADKTWQFFYYKKHFFEHFNLSDSGLLRSPIYQPKIDEYLDKLTYQHPDSLAAAADFLLKKAESSQEAYRYLLVKLTNKFETSNIMGMERVFVYLAENYYLKGKAYWADSALVAKFSQRVKELKPNLVGNQAPEMQLLDTLLRPVRLSSVKSRFTILYFYDPDCGHCKKTTPQLYDLYRSRLKAQNVSVWAACIATDIKKWKDYIKADSLNWINVADPYLHSNFRAEYDVKSTPTIYILDSKKEIIAKRIGVEQIGDFIDHMIEFEESQSKL